MDQDAFRKLLSKNKGSTKTTTTRSSILPPKSTAAQPKPIESKKADFKPRNVKKTEPKYRDRAAERRTGAAGDFAEVEDVLKKFEEQHANENRSAVEEKRKYLGGDSDHTVLVKGLDFALLEQTRARAEASTEDDDLLELAFNGETLGSPGLSSPQASAGSSKKRTREEIIRELKNKRAKGDIDAPAQPTSARQSIEDAKKEGKFKPIGFKPIGSSLNSKPVSESKKKKKKKEKGKAAEEKAKGPEMSVQISVEKENTERRHDITEQHPVENVSTSNNAGFEPVDDDFDIFADAGEYEGMNFDDDDDDDNSQDAPHPESSSKHDEVTVSLKDSQAPHQKWFTDVDPPSPQAERDIQSHSNKKRRGEEDMVSSQNIYQESEEAEPEASSRLVPLASSALPSIRDILAADSALEAEQKRKARKEKRKAGKGEGKLSDEVKLYRDYQKLKSYTDRKNDNR